MQRIEHVRRRIEQARRRRLRRVTFCDRCGQVCGPGCQREAARARHLELAFRAGMGR